MALFPGEELVPVETPNGTVMLPKSVAGTLALAPNGPPPAMPDVVLPQVPGGPAPVPSSGNALAGVPSVADLEKLPPMQAPPTIEGEDLHSKTPTGPTLATPDFGAPPAPAKPAPPKGAAPAAQAPKAPDDDPFAADRAKVEAATAQGVQAEGQIAEAKSQGALDAAAAYKAAAVDQQDIMDAYKKTHLETQAKIAEADDFIKKNTQKIADAKIDRTHDHETMAFIGIALTGLGNALAGKGDAANPAIDMYFKSIDRKVKAQMDDLERTGKIVGLTQQQVDNLRKGLGDNKMLSDFLLTAQTQRHANILNQIAQTTSSEVVKAEALKGVAALNQRAAEFGAGLTEKKVQRDTQREQMATQMETAQIGAKATLGAASMHLQGVREQIASHEKLEREKMDVAMSEKIAELRAKNDAAGLKKLQDTQKANEEGGIGRQGTGEILLNKEGEAKLEEAQKIEKEIADVEKGVDNLVAPMKSAALERLRALKAKAADLRVASQEGAWRVNKEERFRVGKQYGAAQNAIRITREIERLYDKHGKDWFETTEGIAQAQAMYTQLLMAEKEGYGLGVLSKLDVGLLEKEIGDDPTRAWDKHTAGTLAHKIGLAAGLDPEAFKGRLKAVRENAERKTISDFHALRFTGDVKKLFYDPKEAPQSSNEAAVEKLSGLKTEDQEYEDRRLSRSQQAAVSTPPGKFVAKVGKLTGAYNIPESDAEARESASDAVAGKNYQKIMAQDTLILNAAAKGEDTSEARALLVKHINSGKDDTAERLLALKPELAAELRPQVKKEYQDRLSPQKPRAAQASSPDALTDNPGYVAEQARQVIGKSAAAARSGVLSPEAQKTLLAGVDPQRAPLAALAQNALTDDRAYDQLQTQALSGRTPWAREYLAAVNEQRLVSRGR